MRKKKEAWGDIGNLEVENLDQQALDKHIEPIIKRCIELERNKDQIDKYYTVKMSDKEIKERLLTLQGDRDVKIFTIRINYGLPYEKIGRMCGLTGGRVSQIIRKCDRRIMRLIFRKVHGDYDWRD